MSARTSDSLDPWPKRLVRAVGRAYRRNGTEGTREPQASVRIRDAYIAEGGDPATAASEPNKIIATLARVHPDWLHETALDPEQPQRRPERQARHRRSVEAIREVVTAWARGEPLVRIVWLYGSRAAGDPWPGSDVDLAASIDPDPVVLQEGATDRASAVMLTSMDRRPAWSVALASRLVQPVDLKVLARGDRIIRSAVMGEGVRLYRRGR